MKYIVMSAKKRKEVPEFFAPLSYGEAGDVAPDMLLRRGARATLFDAEADAWKALEDSCKKGKEAGDKWMSMYNFYFCEVVEHGKA